MIFAGKMLVTFCLFTALGAMTTIFWTVQYLWPTLGVLAGALALGTLCTHFTFSLECLQMEQLEANLSNEGKYLLWRQGIFDALRWEILRLCLVFLFGVVSVQTGILRLNGDNFCAVARFEALLAFGVGVAYLSLSQLSADLMLQKKILTMKPTEMADIIDARKRSWNRSVDASR